ncbi:MAG TPA: DUF6165 family protein [Rhizomicrobium sp.]|jgi:hypothetical protein
MRVRIPISAGDLIDRITILRIKKKKIPDKKKRAHVGKELKALDTVRARHPELGKKAVRERQKLLHAQNLTLWTVEDRLRLLEAEKRFGKEFVALARRVYRTNDKRAKLKQEINALAGSDLHEVKWFSVPEEEE